MAILKREEFITKINQLIGDDTSDESIKALEDFTDTYNDLEKKAEGDGVDWKKKYEDNDRAWKKKYTNRFLSGNGYSNPDYEDEEETEEDKARMRAESIKIDDLFK